MSGRDLFGRPLPTGSMSGGGSSPPPRPPGPPRPPQGQASSRAMMAAAQDGRLHAFRQLKPVCVQLMGISGQPPTQNSPHASLLARIRQICGTLPPTAFSPSLINYVLFPLTSILRQSNPAELPDGFLEAAFGLLAFLIKRWKAVPGGMDPGAWEQLWRFTIASISPRVGKDRRGPEASQETAYNALDTLTAILQPPTTDAMRQKVGDEKGLMPTLFQTITVSLDCTDPQPPNTTLQRAAVSLLRTSLGYLEGKGNVLASVLPGVVSAMARGIIGGKNLRGDVAASMAGAVQDVLVGTLDDAALRKAGALDPKFDDLADLANAWNEKEEKDEDDPMGDTTPQAEEKKDSKPEPFPPLTSRYLEFTAAQLQATIPPILSSLCHHTSADAREAAVSLASALVSHCRAALPRLIPSSLSTLLLLAEDHFDSVRFAAETSLSGLLHQDSPDLDDALVAILSGAINALPRLIYAGDERRVDDTARVVTAVAHLTSSLPKDRFNAIAVFLGPAGNVERWAWQLLECLEFGRPRGWSTTGGEEEGARTAQLGWSGGMVNSSLPMLTDGGTGTAETGGTEGTQGGVGGGVSPEAQFPHLPLQYVQSPASARRIGDMLTALGAAGGDEALHSVQYFISFARGNRTQAPARAASAVWVADSLLSGIASSSPSKAARKAARDVTRTLVTMDEIDEDSPYESTPQDPEPSDALLPTERKVGLGEITTLLDRPTANASAAEETQRLAAASQRVLLQCLSLRSLSTTAEILGVSFRPLLLHVLYAVLSRLSSPHDLVRFHAEVALARIAHEAGYADARNMVLANVDYVVNAVSQRLTYHRLSANAPLVLIAMIRLVGSEIVPLVHDIVDEIFDALDDFHGYAALASALLAVLNTLIESMAAEGAPEESEQTKEDKRELDRFLRPPRPSDFASFGKWWDQRGQKAQDDIDGILERAPRHGWGKYDPNNPPAPEEGVEMEGQEGEGEQPQDEETPPTREEELASAILRKATFYLSHASPFLRARVLALMADAVPVLASRPSALLPEIDAAWPTVMTRLSDPYPYVAVEAAELIRALCEYVPSYVSRRVADAMPTLLRMLRQQIERDRKSDLASRRVVGDTDRFSTSHRLYMALLDVAKYVVGGVPVKENVVWDVAVAFRPFLDRKAESELQDAARGLYDALNARDGDLTWTVLMATTGRLEGDHGTWDYLRDEKAQMVENVGIVLASGAEEEEGDPLAPPSPVSDHSSILEQSVD